MMCRQGATTYESLQVAEKRLEQKQLPMLHRYTVKHPDGRLFHREAASTQGLPIIVCTGIF
jgi:hypothetical protein